MLLLDCLEICDSCDDQHPGNIQFDEPIMSFLVDIIGSFARPEGLLIKRTTFEQGKCSKEELLQCEDEAIAGIVQFQKEVGLKSITDGEFRRCVVLLFSCEVRDI